MPLHSGFRAFQRALVAHSEHLFSRRVTLCLSLSVNCASWRWIILTPLAQPNIEWNHAHRSKFKTHSERHDVNGVLGARVCGGGWSAAAPQGLDLLRTDWGFSSMPSMLMRLDLTGAFERETSQKTWHSCLWHHPRCPDELLCIKEIDGFGSNCIIFQPVVDVTWVKTFPVNFYFYFNLQVQRAGTWSDSHVLLAASSLHKRCG